MKLRCIHIDRHAPFVLHRYYDVAEILEFPYHCMVRTPAGHWPKPGSRWFGWHPEEFFACPQAGLPALSCGYRYTELDGFGVIIPAPARRHIPRFDNQLLATLNSRPEYHYLYHLRYTGIIRSTIYPEITTSIHILTADYSDLGRGTSYPAATRAIQRILATLNLSSLAKNIGDLDAEFWHKSWRDPGGLIWPN